MALASALWTPHKRLAYPPRSDIDINTFAGKGMDPSHLKGVTKGVQGDQGSGFPETLHARGWVSDSLTTAGQRKTEEQISRLRAVVRNTVPVLK